MVIEIGNYIKLTYTGCVNGVPFDTTDAEAAKKGHIFREGFNYTPAIVKVGAGHVLAGVDEDLVGKEVGKEYKVTIPAEKAFGEHKKDEVKAIDKKAFQKKPEVYEHVTVEGREGLVVNKIGNRYLVDFNHPLAGQAVDYTYKIEAVVSDPVECLEGTIKLITGREMKVNNAHENFVSIEVPAMIAMYNQNWFMTQYMIMQDAFVLFPKAESVKFVENFPRPNKEGDTTENKTKAKKEEVTVAEKKPAEKKPAEKKPAEKKPAAKKTEAATEKKPAEKKPATKKTTAKKAA